MKSWVKEPLLHFLVSGAVLFAAYVWLNHGVDKAQDKGRVVHITANQVEWLKQTWVRQWQRPPTDVELKGLLTDYLKEELLSREARELQLDTDDTVVRRRLAQKMSFLIEDTARLAEPTDEELRRGYEAHPERYAVPARISFTQIYFSPAKRGAQAVADARNALADLARADAAQIGDTSLLPRDIAGENKQAVASLFGGEFARAVFALDPGKWQGPIESGYGLHLVRVSDRQAAQPRAFAELREKVLEDWRREKQQQANEQYFAALLKKYAVVVDESVKPLVGSMTVAQKEISNRE